LSKYWNHAGKNAQKFAKKIAQEKKIKEQSTQHKDQATGT